MRAIICTKWKTDSDVKRILEGNSTAEDEGELGWALVVNATPVRDGPLDAGHQPGWAHSQPGLIVSQNGLPNTFTVADV